MAQVKREVEITLHTRILSEAGGVAAAGFAKGIFLGRPSFAAPAGSLSGRESAQCVRFRAHGRRLVRVLSASGARLGNAVPGPLAGAGRFQVRTGFREGPGRHSFRTGQ